MQTDRRKTDNYSKREQDDFRTHTKESLERIENEVGEVKAQTIKTNGNVGSLKAWRTGLAMCMALVSFIIIPLIIYSFRLSQDNLKQSILLEIRK